MEIIAKGNLIMNEAPKVSIIMPSLNVAQYIRACLQTVVSQTLKEIEILCVDAGSNDGTLAILEEYAQSDARIHILHSDKKSYGYQVNLGMRAAQGKYMGIVETDDIVDLHMFEELYLAAEADNLDIVKADFCRFTTEGGIMRKEPARIAKPEMYGRILWGDSDLDALILNASLYTWAGIYRLSFLRENGIVHNETPGASYQDNGFWFLTMSCARCVRFLDKSFYMLRRDNPNSSINNKGKVYCIRDEYEYILSFLKQKPSRYERCAKLYWWARFGAYRYSHRRIAPEFKEEFIRHFHDVFIPVWNTPALDSSCFSKTSWDDLCQIMKDPIRYNATALKVARRGQQPRTFFNRLKWCYEDNGFVYTIRHILKRVAKKVGLCRTSDRLDALDRKVRQLETLLQQQQKQMMYQNARIEQLHVMQNDSAQFHMDNRGAIK